MLILPQYSRIPTMSILYICFFSGFFSSLYCLFGTAVYNCSSLLRARKLQPRASSDRFCPSPCLCLSLRGVINGKASKHLPYTNFETTGFFLVNSHFIKFLVGKQSFYKVLFGKQSFHKDFVC